MNIQFQQRSVYDSTRGGVTFKADVDGHTRKCIVTDEALNDHFSGDDVIGGAAREQLFERNRARIEAVASVFIEAGKPGDIIVGTFDFA